jgi:hypothetical protein
MAKRPQERYPSCQDLADDLRCWLAGEPVQAPLVCRVEAGARGTGGKPALAVMAALAAVCLGVGVVLGTWMMRSAAPRPHDNDPLNQPPVPVAVGAASQGDGTERPAGPFQPSPRDTQPDVKPGASAKPPQEAEAPRAPAGMPQPERRVPRVQVPVEFGVDTAHALVRIYRLSNDGERILVLKGFGGDETALKAANEGVRNFFMELRNRGGPIGPGPSGPEGVMGGPFRWPGLMPVDPGDTGGTRSAMMVKIEDLDQMADGRPAEDVMPVRLALIVGSFPYREQLEEFRQALRFNDLADLLSDPTAAPQFKGFDVQRAEVKPGDTEDHPVWKDLDLEKTFTPLALLAGRRWENDSPDLDPVIFDGLTMPRPLLLGENHYPKVEDKLKRIADAVAKLKKARQGTLARPGNRFKDGEGFDIFSREGRTAAPGTRPPGADSGQRIRNPMGGFRTPPPGEGGASNFRNQQLIVPEYILLRFLDVTVEPGKAYRYRLRVRMANPQYGNKNVASASPAAEELRSDWVAIDRTVQALPELYYYAIDLKTQGSLEDKKALWNAPSPRPNQVPVQAHRWVEYVYPDPQRPRSGFSVGDWCIAERTLVTRGEYLGQTEPVWVPVWDILQERFSLASLTVSGRKTKQKVPVYFGAEGQPDSVLVDFQGGFLDYNKFAGMDEDKPRYTPVHDQAPTELLILSAEGKLSVRQGDANLNDEDRKAREGAWKKRIEEISQRDKLRPPGLQKPFKGP